MKIEISKSWVILLAIVLLLLLLVFGRYTLGSIKLPGVEFVLTPPPTRIVEFPSQAVDPFYSTPKSESQNPVEFFISYWQNVSDSHYESSWAQLSPRFQQVKHNNNYSDYFQGFDRKYCRIEVSNARLLQQDSNSAIVAANLKYFIIPQCNSVEHEIQSRLIFDYTVNSWLYDETINITAK